MLFKKSKTSKRITYIIIVLILLIFMCLTNFTPSVTRACIMAILMISAKLLFRKFDIYTALAFSLLITLIDNPFAINDIGLQLSYLGTLGIVIFNKHIYNFLQKYINKKIATAMSIVISAQIAVLPITIYYFNNFSTVFLVSNILAVPIVGVIIILGYISIFAAIIYMPLGSILSYITAFFVKLLILETQLIVNIPFSNITIPTQRSITIFFYNFLIFLIFKKKNLKMILSILLIFISIIFIINIFPQNFKIYFIDIGQRRFHPNSNY